MTKKWYVLQSKPNKEQALHQQVLARDIDCFYPTLRVKPVNPRSRKIRPFFPNYMFTYVDLEEIGLSTLQWMPYAQGLLSFDGEPASIPENIIQVLKNRILVIQDQITEKDENKLKQGEKIKVVEGPFKGYEGVFDMHLAGPERVRILLDMIGKRHISVEINTEEIRKK